MQDSLGGNARTFVLGTVSMAPGAVKETLSTLRFLQSAKRIRNTVRTPDWPIPHSRLMFPAGWQCKSVSAV